MTGSPSVFLGEELEHICIFLQMVAGRFVDPNRLKPAERSLTLRRITRRGASMQPFRILFVTPPYHDYNLADQKTYVVEPIQFEVLSSLLDRRRFEIRILDLRLDRTGPAFEKTLKEYRPDMVGFTSWTMHVASVRRLMAQAKSFDSRIVTMVGGHHAGITPSDFADPNIDYVLMGEAYNSFSELMD